MNDRQTESCVLIHTCAVSGVSSALSAATCSSAPTSSCTTTPEFSHQCFSLIWHAASSSVKGSPVAAARLCMTLATCHYNGHV
jgi:hypothetical protein